MVQEAPGEDLTPILKASIEQAKTRRATRSGSEGPVPTGQEMGIGVGHVLSEGHDTLTCPTCTPGAALSPEVEKTLELAKANREAAAASLKEPDKGKLQAAGFDVDGLCACGADIGTYQHRTKGYRFEQCRAVHDKRAPFDKTHHYKRLP